MYFTLIQNSAYFLCIRSAHFHTKNRLSFGQVNTALGRIGVWNQSYQQNDMTDFPPPIMPNGSRLSVAYCSLLSDC